MRIGSGIDSTLTEDETPYIFWADPGQEITLPTSPFWDEKPWKLSKWNIFQKKTANPGLEPRNFKCMGLPAVERFQFPTTSPFKATLLGADSYGFMHIEVEDFMLKVNHSDVMHLILLYIQFILFPSSVQVHYKELESSMDEFYGSVKNRTGCLLQASEIEKMNCSAMVGIRRKRKFIRARVFEVDVNQRVCIVVGAEDPEFSFASFDEIYRLNPRFEYLPPKA